jgi:aryl-alcohol dehydrogenase-like predicted oxidoreductase
MEKYSEFGKGMPPAFRLGLATRGNTHPQPDDVLLALDRGINYWNWCGHNDGMREAIRQLGPCRAKVIVATQLVVNDLSRDQMRRKIERTLKSLATDWIDIATLYYVESEREWNQIVATDGAIEALIEAKEQGLVRSIGLTTHQRPLAAQWAESNRLDMLMVRYNAAHRGAEIEIFPVTDRLRLPVTCFTCLRWGALLESTASDPAGFEIPAAAQWYRFVLSNPSVSVALMAPDNRDELVEVLSLLDDWSELPLDQRHQMEAHGDRVRVVAGPFP